MKRLTFLTGMACVVGGLYMAFGEWALIASGVFLIIESRGLPE